VLLLFVLLLGGGAGAGAARSASSAESVVLLSLLPRNSPTDRADVGAIGAGVEAALDATGHRAGGRQVALSKGSSSDPSNGTESWQSCADIGEKYAANREIVAAIGPLSDQCAMGIVPAFSQAGIALVSPAATAPIFTHAPLGRSGGCSALPTRLSMEGCRPQDFYRGGMRNYAHVTTTVDRQGPAAAAIFAQRHAKRIYVMAAYGYDYWMAGAFRRQARQFGLRIVGFGKPDTYFPKRSAIRRQVHAAIRSRATGLYLVGNEGDLARRDAGLAPFLAAIRKAGFRGTVVGSFWLTAGLIAQVAPRAAEGMYYTSVRLPLAAMPPEASALAARLKLSGRYAIDAAYGAAATRVLLAAIASSDGSRAGVRSALFRFGGDTPAGSFRLDSNGDVVPAKVAIFRVRKGSLRYVRTLIVGPRS
jgi:branched-chain amino acid transport system substrate-binding protein